MMGGHNYFSPLQHGHEWRVDMFTPSMIAALLSKGALAGPHGVESSTGPVQATLLIVDFEARAGETRANNRRAGDISAAAAADMGGEQTEEDERRRRPPIPGEEIKEDERRQPLISDHVEFFPAASGEESEEFVRRQPQIWWSR
eukprot:GHVU01025223.1.p1 GENE.GHVU01025223.1~~GHVU01025223.1.p1  ORF type:complete len:144 (+),score=29.93 GHVU01025223.1:343-774(+)